VHIAMTARLHTTYLSRSTWRPNITDTTDTTGYCAHSMACACGRWWRRRGVVCRVVAAANLRGAELEALAFEFDLRDARSPAAPDTISIASTAPTLGTARTLTTARTLKSLLGQMVLEREAILLEISRKHQFLQLRLQAVHKAVGRVERKPHSPKVLGS
jgi:hypothetical protein